MEQLDALSSQISFATDGNQYLTFTLGQEEYGVEILKVQEIKGYSAITPIPNTPPYIKGVMNLRGTIIPVLDLRAKFDLAASTGYGTWLDGRTRWQLGALLTWAPPMVNN